MAKKRYKHYFTDEDFAEANELLSRFEAATAGHDDAPVIVALEKLSTKVIERLGGKKRAKTLAGAFREATCYGED